MVFHNKNFQYLLWSRISSNIGDSVFYIVSMWVVLEISGSSILTGVAGFLFTLPAISNVLLGPIIDRNNPKKLYILASTLQALLIGLILLFHVSGEPHVWFLLLTIFVLTIFSEIVYPIENVLIPKVVKENELIQANSVMFIAYQGLDFTFNGLSGIMLGLFSLSMIYGVNMIFFLIPIFLMAHLKVDITKKQTVNRVEKSKYRSELMDGITFVFHPLLRAFLFPLGLINFFFAMILVTLPSFANEYGSGSTTYGLTIAFLGLGSIIGALFINIFQSKYRLGIIMTIGFILSGFTWIIMVFSIQLSEALFYILLVLSYSFIGAINVLFTALFQKLPDERMLGRVNTAIESVISIAMPIGSLIGGILTGLTSSIFVLSLFGVGLIGLGMFYLSNKNIQSLPNIDKISKITN